MQDYRLAVLKTDLWCQEYQGCFIDMTRRVGNLTKPSETLSDKPNETAKGVQSGRGPTFLTTIKTNKLNNYFNYEKSIIEGF